MILSNFILKMYDRNCVYWNKEWTYNYPVQCYPDCSPETLAVLNEKKKKDPTVKRKIIKPVPYNLTFKIHKIY